MTDYQTIKRVAKERGLSIKDLLALAPQNDPFYVGRPSQMAAARWFADLWQRFGYTDNIHLRRVHYQAVSQDPPLVKTNGTLYVSERGYVAQLEAYKMYRHNEN